MKKLLFFAVLFLLGITVEGQKLDKDMVLSIHDGKMDLKPGITQDQFFTFMRDKYLKAFEQNFAGTKTYITRSIRGDCTNCYGLVIFFSNDDVRNKYWVKGSEEYTEEGKKANEKMKQFDEELNKYITIEDHYTDWVVL